MSKQVSKTAFITGITGQDGSYLSELLLNKNYKVVGLVRRSARVGFENIKHLIPELQIVYGDMVDSSSLAHILHQYKPDEIYNLAAQSSPADSWKQPVFTADVTGVSPIRLYETVKEISPKSRIYQASTSEMYGNVLEIPQKETTPFNANNPYGVAKLYAHLMARIYREAYGMFISCGILFNHESPRRGLNFITRKVATAVACIKLGVENPPMNEHGHPVTQNGKMSIGNLDGQRDWGYAPEYVEAMWMMLQADEADEFVVATGELHTVKDLCELAFAHVNLNWQDHVLIDQQFARPQETGPLVGDPTKIKKVLGWEAKTKFKTLIGLMVDHEMARFK